MISPRLGEVLQVEQGEAAAGAHMPRIEAMQKPHHDRRLRRRVLEVVSQHSAQCCCAAAHVPLLSNDTFAANLFQTADILTPLHPRRLSRILGERGCREEKRTGKSN